MAKYNYEHVFAAAGFSGETWDITVGHNLSFTSAALATTFTTGTNQISLASGSFPSWMIVGKVFTTDSVTNPGPFRVKQVVSASVIEVYEALTTEATVTAIFSGSANTDVQDVLLSVGNGALTEDTPHVLESTGTLGGARTLSLSAMEVESAGRGGQSLNGRFFYLSVRNSDVSGSNSITISGSGTINGAATFVITSSGDYLFHHTKAGKWRVNTLASPPENMAAVKRVVFTAADWDAGATKNTIKVLQTGSPAAGEVGPHELVAAGSYVVQVINTDMTPDELVDVEIQFAANGDVTLRKTGIGPDFNGVVVLVGSMD